MEQALDLTSITTHRWKIWPCSAVTGENLVSGLDWVVNDVAGRLYYSTANALTQQATQSSQIRVEWKAHTSYFIHLLEWTINKTKVSYFCSVKVSAIILPTVTFIIADGVLIPEILISLINISGYLLWVFPSSLCANLGMSANRISSSVFFTFKPVFMP